MLSVIITTYNKPVWLAKVLHGYAKQTFSDFELVIADDGSGPETAEVIASFQEIHPTITLQHIWHEDDGFRKTIILNQAILAASSDYLLFTDGDCIPRSDLLMTHHQLKEEGYFLSGGYCKLPFQLSRLISENDITSERAFNIRWLRKNGLRKFSPSLKLALPKALARLADAITPTKATWNGQGTSCSKSDLLAVNGFDETMQYGGLDRELGERLWNFGIKSKQLRYRAIILHLDHSRGYADPEQIAYNLALRRKVIAEKLTWSENGMIKGPKLSSSNAKSP